MWTRARRSANTDAIAELTASKNLWECCVEDICERCSAVELTEVCAPGSSAHVNPSRQSRRAAFHCWRIRRLKNVVPAHSITKTFCSLTNRRMAQLQTSSRFTDSNPAYGDIQLCWATGYVSLAFAEVRFYPANRPAQGRSVAFNVESFQRHIVLNYTVSIVSTIEHHQITHAPNLRPSRGCPAYRWHPKIWVEALPNLLIPVAGSQDPDRQRGKLQPRKGISAKFHMSTELSPLSNFEPHRAGSAASTLSRPGHMQAASHPGRHRVCAGLVRRLGKALRQTRVSINLLVEILILKCSLR